MTLTLTRTETFAPVAWSRKTWLAVLGAGAAFSIVKGFRVPSYWASTQAQVDCTLGFVKRCAMGQMMHWLHIPTTHYAVFALVSLGFLIAALAAIWAYVRPLIRSAEGLAAATVFAACFAMAFYVNMIGYYDIPLTLLAVGAISAPSHWRPLSVALAAMFGVVIHEMYLIVFLPLTLLSLLVGERPHWISAATAFLLATAMVIALALRPPASDELIYALQAKARATSDIPIREGYFADVFSHSLMGTFVFTLVVGYISAYWQQMFWLGLWMIAPAVLIGGWLLARAWPELPPLRRFLALGACLTPFAMNLLGVDASRWDALIWLNLALVSGILSRAYGAPRLDTDQRERFLQVAAVAVLVGACTQIWFIDPRPEPMFWPFWSRP